MRRVFTVLSVTLVILLTAAPALASHAWGIYHWARDTKSFTLELGDNTTTAEWSSILGKVATDWSKSKVLDTVKAEGLTNDHQSCKPTLGRVEICNGRYGEQLWVGIARIWIQADSHIVQGVVMNNDSYLDNPKYPSYRTPEARRYVLCQEVGHTLGLDHQDEDFRNESLGTCMDYTAASDFVNNLTPNRHDYQQLELIYEHLDSFTTVGTSAAAAAGYGVSREVTDLPNGLRLISWIIWAR
ncbi:MAG: hypothetical protein ABI900_13075 [Betaproteobacteria bacterium]